MDIPQIGFLFFNRRKNGNIQDSYLCSYTDLIISHHLSSTASTKDPNGADCSIMLIKEPDLAFIRISGETVKDT